VPNGALYGISGSIGGRTPIGTLTLGAGKATGDWAAWITLGVPTGNISVSRHVLDPGLDEIGEELSEQVPASLQHRVWRERG